MAPADRVRGWLRREESAVVLVAIAVAIPAAYLVRFELDVVYAGSFLVLMAVGVGVPTAYERWPHRRGRLRALAWTLLASAAVVAVFVATYTVLRGHVSEFAASLAAFLLADLGLFGVAWVVGRREVPVLRGTL